MKIYAYFFKNWRLKLLALLAALFFWALIVGNQRNYEEHTFKAVVEVVNLKENHEVQRLNPEELRVVLSGYRSAFKKLSGTTDLVIKIDLGNTSAGSRFNFFAEDYLKELPEGIKLVSVYPRIIEVEVEEFVKLELPVQVKFREKLPQGLVLKSWKAEPAVVTALVARSNARNLRSVQTIDIDLSELSEKTNNLIVGLVKSSFIARFIDYQEIKLSLEIVKNE